MKSNKASFTFASSQFHIQKRLFIYKKNPHKSISLESKAAHITVDLWFNKRFMEHLGLGEIKLTEFW